MSEAQPQARHLEATASGSKEPYVWERATIHASITLHPQDADPDGRLISIATWSHSDAPIIRAFRTSQCSMQEEVNSLLEELSRSFPSREALAIERQRLEGEKKAREAREEKERKEKLKGAVSGKSKKKGATPAKSPAKTAAAPAKPTTKKNTKKKVEQGSLFAGGSETENDGGNNE